MESEPPLVLFSHSEAANQSFSIFWKLKVINFIFPKLLVIFSLSFESSKSLVPFCFIHFLALLSIGLLNTSSYWNPKLKINHCFPLFNIVFSLISNSRIQSPSNSNALWRIKPFWSPWNPSIYQLYINPCHWRKNIRANNFYTIFSFPRTTKELSKVLGSNNHSLVLISNLRFQLGPRSSFVLFLLLHLF